MAQVPTAEYSPRFIKRAVTGNGNASKEQVQYMIKNLLNIEETPEFFDATDALAIAVCHLYQLGTMATGTRTAGGKRARSWEEFVKLHPERIKKGL